MPLLHFVSEVSPSELPPSELPPTESSINPTYCETLVSPENSPNELSKIPFTSDVVPSLNVNVIP